MMRATDFHALANGWQTNARLALDTIAMRPTKGIPTWFFQTLQWSQLEELSGHAPGSYRQEPVRVYCDVMRRSGVCYLDQWIPENPLTMHDQGYDGNTVRGATTGAEEVVCDGDADGNVRRLIAAEVSVQQLFGPNMLKGPYAGFFTFPGFLYSRYADAGIGGFQGFQYEDGMDYETICRMTDRHGNPLFIIAGVSVTRTLPYGTPADVRDELHWLVEHGPPVGLMLGCSSSITPGVPTANLWALIEGLAFCREQGRT